MQALKLYRRDNGRYPAQDQGLRALIEKPATEPVPNIWKDGGYLDRLPNDPWGNAYQYNIVGKGVNDAPRKTTERCHARLYYPHWGQGKSGSEPGYPAPFRETLWWVTRAHCSHPHGLFTG
jgi:Type II secretion system (T2SS), protein G